MKLRATLFVLSLALVTLSAAPFAVAGSPASSTGTAQSIGVEFTPIGTLAISGVQKWKFNKGTASGFISNAWDGNAPTLSCTGAGCGTCAPPAAPDAPAPDATQVNAGNPGKPDAAGKNACNFLDGLPLIPGSYTQTAQRSTSCLNSRGRSVNANFNYTYTYVTDGNNTYFPAPFTAWDLISDTGVGDGTVDVPIDATIAGESVLTKAGGFKKYSFSLDDGLGNRVQNLSVAINGAPVAYPLSTVHFPVDFFYTGNAGSNGTAAVKAYLVNGNARTILNTDSFAGNNNGGSDGAALAQATMDTVTVNLGPGDYNVVLNGTVKGNSASASLSFSVSQHAQIVTPGCSLNPAP